MRGRSRSETAAKRESIQYESDAVGRLLSTDTSGTLGAKRRVARPTNANISKQRLDNSPSLHPLHIITDVYPEHGKVHVCIFGIQNYSSSSRRIVRALWALGWLASGLARETTLLRVNIRSRIHPRGNSSIHEETAPSMRKQIHPRGNRSIHEETQVEGLGQSSHVTSGEDGWSR